MGKVWYEDEVAIGEGKGVSKDSDAAHFPFFLWAKMKPFNFDIRQIEREVV